MARNTFETNLSRDSSALSLGLGVILQRSMLMGQEFAEKAGSGEFIGMVKERNLEMMNARHKLNYMDSTWGHHIL